MIHINIKTKNEGYMQIWSPAPSRRHIVLNLDTKCGLFTRPNSTKLDTDTSVFLRISINDMIRACLLIPFPGLCGNSLDHDDIAFVVRLWSNSGALIEHASIPWTMLWSAIDTEHIVVSVTRIEGVGKTPPASARRETIKGCGRGLQVRLPTTPRNYIYVDAANVFLVHKDAPIMTERWLEDRLNQALRIVADNRSVFTIHTEALSELLSFMFLRPRKCAHKQKHTGVHLDFVDHILRNPSCECALVIISYHLLTSLLVHTWTNPNIRMLQSRIIAELGIPFVSVNTKSSLRVLMVPLPRIPQMLDVAAECAEMPDENTPNVSQLRFYASCIPLQVEGVACAWPYMASSSPVGGYGTLMGNAHDWWSVPPKELEDTLPLLNKHRGALEQLDVPRASRVEVSERVQAVLEWAGSEGDLIELNERLLREGLVAHREDTWEGELIVVGKKSNITWWF